jgi:hypothetical protein
VGIAGLRDSKRVRPESHGAINETRFEDGRLINLEGEVWSTVSQEAAYAELRLITRPMIETLDHGPALMRWTEGASGLALQRLVKLDGGVEPPLEEAAAFLRYQAQFFAEDPRAYSQTLSTATGISLSTATGGLDFSEPFPWTFAPSGGGTAVVTNDGNRPTPPVFRIYGQIVNPQIILVGTDSRIVLTGTVPAGDFLEIGTSSAGRRYVKLSGLTDRLNFYDAAASTWFDLPPGSSTIQLIGASFDTTARIDVLYRSAYA